MKANRLKIAIAQMNPTVGDYAANSKKIRQWILAAEKKKADLIVFPEMSLPGYPVWDLARKQGFIQTCQSQLEKIVRFSKGKKVSVILGVIEPGKKAQDRSFNTLVMFSGGKVLARQQKRLLPTYDVFLEDIYFQSGQSSEVIPWKSWRIGPTICEDIWDECYRVKPLRDLKSKRTDLFINISASPFYRDVAVSRTGRVRKHAVHYQTPFLYVNQVGAQDDLIFDGRSLFVDAKGKILFRAPAFEEGLYFFDWYPNEKDPAALSLNGTVSAEAEIYNALRAGIRDYCRKNRFKKVLVGMSGGIDSALTAAIAVDALGPDAVLGVTMPGAYSSKGSWEDSEELSQNLGMELRVHPIRRKFDFLMREFRKQDKKAAKKPTKKKVTVAMENLQARLRGLELMYLSNDEGRLLLTTGNKSELAVGYCTLYGDMAGGLAVLGDVYKTDVYRLAWYRNQKSPVIPEQILTKAPSAELRPDQTDQDSLPSYDVLDEILYLYIEKNKSRDEIIKEVRRNRVSRQTVIEVIGKVDHNEYKRRQTPPILRVTEKAWFGRRMPITNRFDG